MKKIFYRKTVLIALLVSLLLGACNLRTPPPQPTSTPIPAAVTQSPDPTTYSAEITPQEEPRFADADIALSFGDYEEALTLYQNTRKNSPESEAASAFGIAITHLKQGKTTDALTQFQALTEAYPKTNPGKRAWYWIGELEDDNESKIAAYQNYLEGIPNLLGVEVNQKIGSLYAQIPDPVKSLEALTQAYLAPAAAKNLSLLKALGAAFTDQGQSDRAAEIYQQALSDSVSSYDKAMFSLLLGQLERARGNTEAGNAHLLSVVENFPETYDAYTALTILQQAGVTVSDLYIGLINYHRGELSKAMESFDVYLAGDGFKKDTALYYKALTRREQGRLRNGLGTTARATLNMGGGAPEDKEAISAWNELINNYPASPYMVDAMEDVIYTQYAYMGQPQPSIDSALIYIAQAPGATWAPQLLWVAGRTYETEDKLEEAARIWLKIGTDYPDSDLAYNGLFFSGILFYRLNMYTEALNSFNRAALATQDPTFQSGAYFWLGKVHQNLSGQEKAIQQYEMAIQTDPMGYYAIRAKEVLEGTAPLPDPAKLNFRLDWETLRHDASEWMIRSYSLPDNINLDYSSELFSDINLQRGLEMARLGLFEQADLELGLVRNKYLQDPINLFRLLKVFEEYGFYKSAILASKALTKMAGFGSIPMSAAYPPYFSYITYGPYYLKWIKPTAENWGYSPLLLLSLIHQESHFDGIAHSSAGAGGLMQIMPATAAQIAEEINYPPNFTREDLFIPYINLNLGSNYLARQLFYFSGDKYAALAAYNGGPSGAIDWKNKAGDDLDVFVGTIRFQETRAYIRQIVEIYNAYQIIYGE